MAKRKLNGIFIVPIYYFIAKILFQIYIKQFKLVRGLCSLSVPGKTDLNQHTKKNTERKNTSLILFSMDLKNIILPLIG